jgi:hypothetical protein
MLFNISVPLIGQSFYCSTVSRRMSYSKSKMPCPPPPNICTFRLDRKLAVSYRDDVPIMYPRQRGIRWHVRLILSASQLWESELDTRSQCSM